MHANIRVVPGGSRMHAKDIVPGGLVAVRTVRRPIGRSTHRLGRRRRRRLPTVPTVSEVQQRTRLRADAARFGRNPPRRALLLDGDAVHRQQGREDKREAHAGHQLDPMAQSHMVHLGAQLALASLRGEQLTEQSIDRLGQIAAVVATRLLHSRHPLQHVAPPLLIEPAAQLEHLQAQALGFGLQPLDDVLVMDVRRIELASFSTS